MNYSWCGTRRPRTLSNKSNRFLHLSYNVVNAKDPNVDHGFRCKVTCTRSTKPTKLPEPEENQGQCCKWSYLLFMR